MKYSRLGASFGGDAGIVQLMDDLGSALATNRDMLMLGGGNPGRIAEMETRFRRRMQQVLDDGTAFEDLVSRYGPPEGHAAFRAALAQLLRNELGWDIRADNIALTNGSQSATFMLFNLLGGEDADGVRRRIVLPLAPEYIGYADQGTDPALFSSARPNITLLADGLFKYHVDFDAQDIGDDVAAICVSRPTNPTGNVLTDEEVRRLRQLAGAQDVPLIVDSAYGLPFPGIVFSDATPIWDDTMIVCMSLSKLGLPGVRTGIVIAEPELIRALTGMNAIINLTTGGFGPELTLDLVRNGDILRLSREVIRPFYERKALAAVERLQAGLPDHPLRIHKPEGAIFLWLWFEGLPITCQELYERLKGRGVLVIPGQHFFPGLDNNWPHRHECIRVNYSQDTGQVHAGLDIIADEVRRAYDGR